MREENPGVHVGLSTDGTVFRESNIFAGRGWIEDPALLAEQVVGEGFSFELMVAEHTPDRWTGDDLRVIEKVVEAVRG